MSHESRPEFHFSINQINVKILEKICILTILQKMSFFDELLRNLKKVMKLYFFCLGPNEDESQLDFHLPVLILLNYFNIIRLISFKTSFEVFLNI